MKEGQKKRPKTQILTLKLCLKSKNPTKKREHCPK